MVFCSGTCGSNDKLYARSASNILSTPFELVHAVLPDTHTWSPIFSVGFCPVKKDGGLLEHKINHIPYWAYTLVVLHPQNRLHFGTLKTNAFIIRKPTNSARIFSQHHFPTNIQYNGSLYGTIYFDHNTIPKPYPPGTRLYILIPNESLAHGTVYDIPVLDSEGPTDASRYLVTLGNERVL